MLKPILLLSAGISLTLAPAVLAAPQSGQAPTAVAASTKNPTKITPESQAKAKSIYQIDCAVCHGDNGNGKTDLATSMSLNLNDWTDPKTLADKQDGELYNMIRNGKDKMPPEDPARAKNDEVWNLVTYIRSFSKAGSAAAATAAK